MQFASALPVSANAGVGWAATRQQVMVSAVEHATCAAPMQGMTPRTLELALFYDEVRLSALIHGLGEAQCDAWTADMEAMMLPPVALWRVFRSGNYAIMGKWREGCSAS
jgi:hypothetical protein